MESATFDSKKDHRVLPKLAIVLVVTAASFVVSLQGWKGRFSPGRGQDYDMVIAMQEARRFVDEGRIPVTSGRASMRASLPPGVSWSLVPGELVFKDPRLYEAVGAGILFFATTLGLFLLGKEVFSSETGIYAALLYGVSPVGLFFATSLWPRGHPCFVVWTVYLCVLAVKRSNANFLACGLFVYALGLYFFLEAAPSGIVFALSLYVNRELRRFKPVFALVILAALLVWSPWLAKEYKANFRGLISLATNSQLPPTRPIGWCSSVQGYDCLSGNPVDFEGAAAPEKFSIGALVKNAVPSMTSNMEGRFPGRASVFTSPGCQLAPPFPCPSYEPSSLKHSSQLFAWPRRISPDGFVLGPIFSATLLALLITGALTTVSDYRKVRVLAAIIAVGSVIAGLILDPWVFARVASHVGIVAPVSVASSRTLEIELLCVSMLLWWFSRRLSADRTAVEALLIVGTFVVGQVFWSVLDGGANRRFWWLWPLQCLLICWGAERVFSGHWRKIVLAALVTGVALNPILIVHLSSWTESSWAGVEDPVITMLDIIAHRSTTHTVSLSYEGPVQSWVLRQNLVDSRYAAGMLFDAYLNLRYGLSNEQSCAEGFDSRSVFYIRDSRRLTGRTCFSSLAPPRDEYDQITASGGVTLYKRRIGRVGPAFYRKPF